jgi:ABC-type transport system involved in cytochrome c biogenesis permease subunit
VDKHEFKLVAFGFLNNAVMIVSGAIWAYRLWGSFWRWDPVETWSLLTWLAYGLYMHAKLTLGWGPRRLAWIALFALFGVMMSFWGVQLLPNSFHLFQDLGGGLMETGRMQ